MIWALSFIHCASRVLVIFGLALVGAAITCQAAEVSGQVVGITDGDTITVLDIAQHQHQIRLMGIDAPEKRQAFGQRSKQSLSELVFGRSVTVETKKKDRYGRDIGKVLLDGQDVNLEQVRRGMAWHYKAYEREQSAADRQMYTDAEEQARKARVGLWNDADPVPPWEFRHRKVDQR